MAYLLTKTRISPIEFYIHQYKPENSENLQAPDWVYWKIAPFIVQEKSITAQNSYIHILADSLASFDYAQIEQIVNESRQRAQRQNRMEGISRPTPINMPVTKQLSATMRAEAHLYRVR